MWSDGLLFWKPACLVGGHTRGQGLRVHGGGLLRDRWSNPKQSYRKAAGDGMGVCSSDSPQVRDTSPVTPDPTSLSYLLLLAGESDFQILF